MHHRFCDRLDCVPGGRDDCSNHSPISSPTHLSPAHGRPYDSRRNHGSDHSPSAYNPSLDALVFSSPRLQLWRAAEIH